MAKKKRRTKYTTKSKGHGQVSKYLRKMGFNIIDEYYIENLPYDIYIKEHNLIIEYYGDRWHYPKNIYPADYWDKVKKRYAWEKWEKDKRKIEFAKKKGFSVEVVWENEWKKISNKRRYLEKIINRNCEL